MTHAHHNLHAALRLIACGLAITAGAAGTLASSAPPAGPTNTPPPSNILIPIEQNVEDANHLAVSQRLLPVDLRAPTNFEHVYRIPTSGPNTPAWAQTQPMFARASGALTAIFPQSSYVPTRRGLAAEIPAGTVFTLTDPTKFLNPQSQSSALNNTHSSDTSPNQPAAARPPGRAVPLSAREQLTVSTPEGSGPNASSFRAQSAAVRSQLPAAQPTAPALRSTATNLHADERGELRAPPKPEGVSLWNNDTFRQQRVADLLMTPSHEQDTPPASVRSAHR